MPLTHLTCPNCSAVLRPAKPVAEGARVRCPKCKGPFTAGEEPPAEDEAVEAAEPEEEEALEAEPAEEEEEAVAEEPRKKRRARREEEEEDRDRPRRKRAKKRGVPVWVWMVLGGVAILLLVSCIGVGGYFGLAYFGGNARVTLDNFEKINGNMTEADVTALLGPPTEVVDDANAPGPHFFQGNVRTLNWKNGENAIAVIFNNGKVSIQTCQIDGVQRSRIGNLGFSNDSGPQAPIKPPPPNISITLANYNQIQKGMSEAQVKVILGEPTMKFDWFGKKTLTWQNLQGAVEIDLEKDQVTNRSCNMTEGGLHTFKQGW